jgi:dihydrodipicolinate synthase/N-acetylneuraminate lyase
MSKSLSLLRGVFAPVPTPFTAGGQTIDTSKISENFERFWFDPKGKPFFDGACVMGSNGEFPLLNETEKEGLLSSTLDVARSVDSKIRLIAGTGCPSTQMTIDRSNLAADMGFVDSLPTDHLSF